MSTRPVILIGIIAMPIVMTSDSLPPPEIAPEAVLWSIFRASSLIWGPYTQTIIMLRNPEIETKKADASKDIDPESEIWGDDDLSVKDEVDERRGTKEHGDDTPDRRIHRRVPPSESEPDL